MLREVDVGFTSEGAEGRCVPLLFRRFLLFACRDDDSPYTCDRAVIFGGNQIVPNTTSTTYSLLGGSKTVVDHGSTNLTQTLAEAGYITESLERQRQIVAGRNNSIALAAGLSDGGGGVRPELGACRCADPRWCPAPCRWGLQALGDVLPDKWPRPCLRLVDHPQEDTLD